jgi:hypothetical protein
MFHYCVHLLHFTEGVAYKRIAVAWARSPQHRESNIHLRCHSHNQYAADLDFGASYMAARRKRANAAAKEVAPARSLDLGRQLDLNPVAARRDRGVPHGDRELQIPEQQALWHEANCCELRRRAFARWR